MSSQIIEAKIGLVVEKMLKRLLFVA